MKHTWFIQVTGYNAHILDAIRDNEDWRQDYLDSRMILDEEDGQAVGDIYVEDLNEMFGVLSKLYDAKDSGLDIDRIEIYCSLQSESDGKWVGQVVFGKEAWSEWRKGSLLLSSDTV